MNNLQKLRTEKKMSQLQLGMAIGVDQVTVSGYECDKSYPSVEVLLKMCDLFHVSSDYLLDRTPIRPAADSLVVDNLSAQELELLTFFRKLSREKQGRAIGFVMGMAE